MKSNNDFNVFYQFNDYSNRLIKLKQNLLLAKNSNSSLHIRILILKSTRSDLNFLKETIISWKKNSLNNKFDEKTLIMKRIIQLAERLSLFENYNSTNFYFENQSIYSISTIDSLSLCGFKEKLNIQLLEEKIIALKNKKNFLLMNIEEEQDNLREEKNILKNKCEILQGFSKKIEFLMENIANMSKKGVLNKKFIQWRFK